MLSLFEDLHTQLSNYPAATQVQQEFLAQIQSHSQTKEVLSALYFTPGHITVSALILSPDQQNVALIFHPFLQLWLQPGGHLEPTDATLLAGARREAEEEISISNLRSLLPYIFDIDIHNIPENAKKKQPSHLHMDIRFLFQSQTWELQAASEIKSAKWVPLSAIEETMTDDSVRRLIRKLNIAPL